MTAIAKSAKTHPAAKKCCGWEEHAIYAFINIMETFYVDLMKTDKFKVGC